jgi:hypothetical protein
MDGTNGLQQSRRKTIIQKIKRLFKKSKEEMSDFEFAYKMNALHNQIDFNRLFIENTAAKISVSKSASDVRILVAIYCQFQIPAEGFHKHEIPQIKKSNINSVTVPEISLKHLYTVLPQEGDDTAALGDKAKS